MTLESLSFDPACPPDLETCVGIIQQLVEKLAQSQRILAELQETLAQSQRTEAETASMAEKQAAAIEKLRAELELFKRYLFGRRSERCAESPGQGHLFNEPAGDGAEMQNDGAAEAESPSADEAAESDEDPQRKRRRRARGHGWSKLPEDFERVEEIHDVPEDQRTCPCCGKPLVRIGEDRSERVDIDPAKVIVRVIVRPKYACPGKDGGVKQEPPPPAPTPGGRFDFGFVTYVVAGKLAYHLPLYRLQDILASSGLEISRATLCDTIRRAADLVQPLTSLMTLRLLASDLLGVDDTPVRQLDRLSPSGVRTARFWLYRGFAAAPFDLFQYHDSRKRDGPAKFLSDFAGWVKVDAYGVHEGVYLGHSGRIFASCCWAHACRKFFETSSSHPRLSAQALAYIHRLYEIEDRARELSPDARRLLREFEARPILSELQRWLEEQRRSALPKSNFAGAVGYALNQWKELTTYLEDGRLPIDNNLTESELRRLTIGRKNWLFIGAPEAGPRAAALYSVVASAMRHHLDVSAYLRDALEQLACGSPDQDWTPLLPDEWAKSHPQFVRGYRQREREQAAKARHERWTERRASPAPEASAT